MNNTNISISSSQSEDRCISVTEDHSSALVESIVDGEIYAKISRQVEVSIQKVVVPHLVASEKQKLDMMDDLAEVAPRSKEASQLTMDLISSMIRRIDEGGEIDHRRLLGHAQFIANVSSRLRHEEMENRQTVSRLRDEARKQQLECAQRALSIITQVADHELSLVAQQVELLREHEKHTRSLEQQLVDQSIMADQISELDADGCY